MEGVLWWYLGTITEDLRDRLDLPLIKVFFDIENVLLNFINSPTLPLSIDHTDKTYGNRSNKENAPLDGMKLEVSGTQSGYLRSQWREIKGDEVALSSSDVVSITR